MEARCLFTLSFVNVSEVSNQSLLTISGNVIAVLCFSVTSWSFGNLGTWQDLGLGRHLPSLDGRECEGLEHTSVLLRTC